MNTSLFTAGQRGICNANSRGKKVFSSQQIAGVTRQNFAMLLVNSRLFWKHPVEGKSNGKICWWEVPNASPKQREMNAPNTGLDIFSAKD